MKRLALWAVLLAMAAFYAAPARALPLFARRYGVTCSACHTIAPRLNRFGRAFQANLFNWPGGPPAPKSWTARIPLSVLATASSIHNLSTGFSDTDFRNADVFLAGGFSAGSASHGGFFIQDTVVNRAGAAGDLGDAFVSLSGAGTLRPLAVTVGVFTPMMYQYDPINRLTPALPVALGSAVDAFSFTDAVPGIRVDYFSHRGEVTPDGYYAAVGVPFRGHLSARADAQLHGSRGAFAHVFRRSGPESLGAFGFVHGSSHTAGILATRELRQDLNVTGIASLGHDGLGDHRELSLEGEYLVNPAAAVNLRIDASGGVVNQVFPVAALTYYPFHRRFLRLTAQGALPEGDHTANLYLTGQF